MHRIRIIPQWTFGTGRGSGTLPALIALLGAIHDNDNLRDACRDAQLSYRYAWGLIQQGAEQFGAPLVTLMRGQGAALTPLGEKLVWADRRVKARLAPILYNLVSEVVGELARTVAGEASRLRVQATHGYVMSALRDLLEAHGVAVDLQISSPVEALGGVSPGPPRRRRIPGGERRPRGALHRRARCRASRRRRPRRSRGTRRKGIIVAAGNPLGLVSIADLARPALRYVNRPRGSGTRSLLDLLLARHAIGEHDVTGYDVCDPRTRPWRRMSPAVWRTRAWASRPRRARSGSTSCWSPTSAISWRYALMRATRPRSPRWSTCWAAAIFVPPSTRSPAST